MAEEKFDDEFSDEFDDEMVNPTRSALAAVAAGVLVIIAGFLVWNYLQSLGGESDVQDIEEILQEVEDKNMTDEESSSDKKDKEIVLEPGDSETVTINVDQKTPEPTYIGGPESTMSYVVNDYNQGQIEAGEYQVKAGDTLWEIAEAVYGSGFEWQTIADANPSLVYTLANGNVGIDTGVTLTIPSM